MSIPSLAKNFRTGAAALLMAALAAGCGDDSPDARLAEVEESIESAVLETRLAKENLEALRERVDSQEDKLEEAKRELASAQASLVETVEEADDQITDVAIFRVLQSSLLEDEELEPFAVRVVVQDRNVTLHGRVDTEEQAQHAIGIARDTFGVRALQNRLLVGEKARRAGESPETS